MSRESEDGYWTDFDSDKSFYANDKRYVRDVDCAKLSEIVGHTNEEAELFEQQHLEGSEKAARKTMLQRGWLKAKIKRLERGIRRKTERARKKRESGCAIEADVGKLARYRGSRGLSCNPLREVYAENGSGFHWFEPCVLKLSRDPNDWTDEQFKRPPIAHHRRDPREGRACLQFNGDVGIRIEQVRRGKKAKSQTDETAREDDDCIIRLGKRPEPRSTIHGVARDLASIERFQRRRLEQNPDERNFSRTPMILKTVSAKISNI